MENKLQRENKGLSEVVSALILLVIAVLLAAVVTYYATNITLTRTNIEEARITKESIWVNATGAVSAFKLQNLGGRDILIDGIKVRATGSTRRSSPKCGESASVTTPIPTRSLRRWRSDFPGRST